MHKEVCDEVLSIRTYIILTSFTGFFSPFLPFFLLGFWVFGGSFREGFGVFFWWGVCLLDFLNSSLHLLWETGIFFRNHS